MKRLTKKQLTDFHKKVTDFLVECGAEAANNGPYTHKLITICGPLFIAYTGYEAGFAKYNYFINCRFEDVANAREFYGQSSLRLNPHSGKWNWIHDDPERLLIGFKLAIQEILPQTEKASIG